MIMTDYMAYLYDYFLFVTHRPIGALLKYDIKLCWSARMNSEGRQS